MKTIALITTGLVACAYGALAEDKPVTKSENKTSSSVSITSNSSDGKGKGVIEIDVNGKKERREIELPGGTGKVIVTSSADAHTGPQTFLGVSPSPLSESVADQLPIAKGTGLLVATVQPDSPAAQAGLQKNDVLARFDDQILTNTEQLVALVRIKKPGDEVKLTYYRKGQEATANVKLANWEGKSTDKRAALTIDTNGNILKIDDLLKSVAQGGSPLTFEKRVMIVEPDGKVIVSDVAKTVESIAAELESAIKNQVAPEVMDAVKKALDQARKAVEDGAKRAEDSAPKK